MCSIQCVGYVSTAESIAEYIVQVCRKNHAILKGEKIPYPHRGVKRVAQSLLYCVGYIVPKRQHPSTGHSLAFGLGL